MPGLGADYITILSVPKDAVLFHVLGDCVEGNLQAAQRLLGAAAAVTRLLEIGVSGLSMLELPLLVALLGGPWRTGPSFDAAQ